jgi:DnaA family protein
VRQLTFELAAADPPSFANFVAGSNAEVLAVLARMAHGELAETGVVLWGARGAGKSHLLRATVAAAGAAGRAARYCRSPAALDDDGAPGMLVAIDAIDTAQPAAQGSLFTLYNTLAAGGGQLLAAAEAPPARLPLRDDLRTRLGHGLIYEVLPLADDDKAAALSSYARERGFRLADEVLAYLLAHGSRDMPALVATLAALDRHSLSIRRPITVPLVREWLQQSGRGERTD